MVATALAGPAMAQAYPVLRVDATVSSDPDLARFLQDVSEAAFDPASGEVDPKRTFAFSRERIAILTGSRLDPAAAAFSHRVDLPAPEALALLGRATDPSVAAASPERQLRAGLVSLHYLLRDTFVGPCNWLAGMIASEPWGRLDAAVFADLLRNTGTTADEWAVARQDHIEGLLPGTKPFRGQLLRVDHDAPLPRSCCWVHVVIPSGVGVNVRTGLGSSALAPYLRDHVGFERENGVWRIAALALRIEEAGFLP